MLAVSTLILVLSFVLLSQGEGHYRNFASKTRYYEPNLEEDIKKEREGGCSAVHMSLVARHGTRNPSKRDVKKIQRTTEAIDQLFSGHPVKIGNLTIPSPSLFTENMDKDLIEIGREELYNMSRRVKQRYPELFNVEMLKEKIRFVSTRTARSIQSAHAFALGLLGRPLVPIAMVTDIDKDPITIETHDKDNDPVLRYFDVCPKYIHQVSKNKTSLYEHHEFKNSSAMRTVVEHVRDLFNLQGSEIIHVKHVIGMYLACTFEVAVYNRSDSWCSVFRPSDLDVLEYFYDLKHYWKRGYGYKITYEISCVLLKNIINTIKTAVLSDNKNGPIGNFMFAHAETIQPLNALLGLFKDVMPLRADNYHRHKNRKYRASQISPFGANIAFTVYNCSGLYQIQVLSNEKIVSLPCCEGPRCPLQRFFDCFSEVYNMCDLKALCELDKKAQVREDL
ncbi:predicted protein [Nematostella vectensis]|uniref:Multiple inositol polyphosphate phosphatase 1 n=1 Tax=Nematostella vectensis TaxID=45351 RepID=A7RIX6_NEMVE|nr:predicted protein [Nematostella vectensis]|eukprot:XP_001640538.1 predicted protein [Nematostella vectensis]